MRPAGKQKSSINISAKAFEGQDGCNQKVNAEIDQLKQVYQDHCSCGVQELALRDYETTTSGDCGVEDASTILLARGRCPIIFLMEADVNRS